MRALRVSIKSEQDIEKLRISGRLAAQVLQMIGEHVKPGVTTEYLDDLCHDYIVNTLKSIVSVCILLVLIRVVLLLSFVWQSSFIDVSCVLKTI